MAVSCGCLRKSVTTRHAHTKPFTPRWRAFLMPRSSTPAPGAPLHRAHLPYPRPTRATGCHAPAPMRAGAQTTGHHTCPSWPAPAPTPQPVRAGGRQRREVHSAPCQAPLRPGRMPSARPARHPPLPRPHQGTGQGTRDQAGTRVRPGIRPHPSRPRTHRPGRPGHLLAVRHTHRTRRRLAPRTRRPQPVDHPRTRTCTLQPQRSRTSLTRPRADHDLTA